MEKQQKFEVAINGGLLICSGDYSPEQKQTQFDPYWPATFDLCECHTATGSDVFFLLSQSQIREIEAAVLVQINENELECAE